MAHVIARSHLRITYEAIHKGFYARQKKDLLNTPGLMQGPGLFFYSEFD